jgi:phosphatidylglycerol:prolipoprotein diacylglycerol transferase
VAKYHPLFLYESLWNFANVFFLLWLSHTKSDKLLPGDIFLIYLITYPFGRFFLEFLRLDYPRIGTINTNQTVMLVVMIASAALLIWRHSRRSDIPK